MLAVARQHLGHIGVRAQIDHREVAVEHLGSVTGGRKRRRTDSEGC